MLSELYEVAAGLLVMAVVCAVMIKKKCQNDRVLLTAVFILYMTGLFAVTLFPVMYDHSLMSFANTPQRCIRLVPFEFMREAFGRTYIFYVPVQLGGNFVMTIPFGILLPMLLKDKKPLLYILLFFLLPVFIETTQLTVGALLGTFYRTTDVDDVILNFSGAMAGYGIYCVMSRIFRRKKQSNNME